MNLFCQHPVFGELRWTESSSFGRVLAGSALLTPKHAVRVYIHVAEQSGDEGAMRAVAESAELFAQIRRSDWAYRMALAKGLLVDLAGYVSEAIPISTEGMARLFTLTDINFIDRNAIARLAYLDLTANPALTPWHMDVIVNRSDLSFTIDLYPQS